MPFSERHCKPSCFFSTPTRLRSTRADDAAHWRALPGACARVIVVEPSDEVIAPRAQLLNSLKGKGYEEGVRAASSAEVGSVGVMEALRGTSAHNRLWSEGEMRRVVGVLSAAMKPPLVGNSLDGRATEAWKPPLPDTF